MTKVKKVKVELTLEQYSVLSDILFEVRDKLQWNEEEQEYQDFGNIICSMSKEEYEALQSIHM